MANTRKPIRGDEDADFLLGWDEENARPRPVLCDQFGYLGAVSPEHARIHNGTSYFCGKLWGEAGSDQVANDASIEILIQPASGMHTIMNVSAGGDCEVEPFEGVTFSAAGTELTKFNKNRFSSNTSSATISYGPTVSDYGTPFPGLFLPGGTGPKSSGGSDGSFSRETILKTNVNHLVRVTNRSNSTTSISVSIEWYET